MTTLNHPAMPRQARTITEQTGWKRPHPKALCQDFDVRTQIHEYDFDSSDMNFQAYCRSRGLACRFGKLGSERRAFMDDHAGTKDQFMRLECVNFAEEQPDGSRHKYSDKHKETFWTIHLSNKGALQDAWELYQSELRSKDKVIVTRPKLGQQAFDFAPASSQQFSLL
ncbi:hypothetical protein SAMN04515647_4424 [Cohaesibacter sp. ES.047]|uniref:hypothetical protein n=1 Tax=Cohaesibacter sp. ES.047 TaxID=1798205 RepID=UPI000BBFC518|nr:hypothetical protein [Cohaesibacter sp. ES.047]SNY94101.1 hypothetical protein SAMN04515647_4424 [Cohaesibacter sp. ES.047]